MNTIYRILGAVILSLCLCNTLAAPNLTKVKDELIQYHDDGAYAQDISAVTRHALYYLKFRINQNQRTKNPKKLAVVFDIDETTLSNYDDMRYLDFGGTMHEIDALESEAHDPAIPYSRTLYNFAKNNGVSIFFVTGRPEYMRQATIKNLNAAGYNHWQALYMKPNKYHQVSIVPYKSAMRKKIIDAGYDIVFNIGDQNSDLEGGFADMTFKLPDPYYLIK